MQYPGEYERVYFCVCTFMGMMIVMDTLSIFVPRTYHHWSPKFSFPVLVSFCMEIINNKCMVYLEKRVLAGKVPATAGFSYSRSVCRSYTWNIVRTGNLYLGNVMIMMLSINVCLFFHKKVLIVHRYRMEDEHFKSWKWTLHNCAIKKTCYCLFMSQMPLMSLYGFTLILFY